MMHTGVFQKKLPHTYNGEPGIVALLWALRCEGQHMVVGRGNLSPAAAAEIISFSKAKAKEDDGANIRW